MIKFFRRIRYDLMSENPQEQSSRTGKTTRYFKYAIGEIALVMIGILLALQVNDWNENRKTIKQEINILKQLQSDLKENSVEVKETNDLTKNRVDYSKMILSYLEENRPVDDSLKLAFEWLTTDGLFNVANTTYKYIENQGINVLTNDGLRAQITEMYERHFKNITIRESLNWALLNDKLFPLMEVDFKSSKAIINDDEMGIELGLNEPLDMNALSQNQQFKNVVLRIHNWLKLRYKWQNQTIIELEALIYDVDAEIKRLSP
ncbi:DUF6090 family protein [Winogradskyella sp. A3E31]|uniref:DUF6090 family protein n=1 Tax=Winogradskyella sp. A3E31 TaxID=3349637 RepID=UPI00398A8AE8